MSRISGITQAVGPAASAGWRAASPVLGDLLKKGAYVGAAVLGAPYVASGLRGGLQSVFPETAVPQGSAGVPAGGAPDPSNTQPQSQETFEEQIKILTELLKEKNRQSAAYSEEELKQKGRLIESVIDPAFYAQRAAIDQANYERMQELGRIAGMEQTRELTRRKIEGDTIAAWRGITEAQINRDATLGLGMMQLAYTAGMPNPNVLQGGASLAGQGRASFGTPSSTIS